MEEEEAMLDGKKKEADKPQREFKGFAEGRSK
jgi:hypothetical protein